MVQLSSVSVFQLVGIRIIELHRIWLTLIQSVSRNKILLEI